MIRQRPPVWIDQSEVPEAIWEPFHHQSPEQLKMKFQRPSGNRFATRARNSSKWASRAHLEALLPPEPGMLQNEPPETIWEPFCHQSLEHLKMSLQRSSGSTFATRPRNWSKWASRDHLGALLSPEPGTPQNQPPEAIWEGFCHHSWQHLKMSVQGCKYEHGVQNECIFTNKCEHGGHNPCIFTSKYAHRMQNLYIFASKCKHGVMNLCIFTSKSENGTFISCFWACVFDILEFRCMILCRVCWCWVVQTYILLGVSWHRSVRMSILCVFFTHCVVYVIILPSDFARWAAQTHFSPGVLLPRAAQIAILLGVSLHLAVHQTLATEFATRVIGIGQLSYRFFEFRRVFCDILSFMCWFYLVFLTLGRSGCSFYQVFAYIC